MRSTPFRATLAERARVAASACLAVLAFLHACREAGEDEILLLEDEVADTVAVAPYWDDKDRLTPEEIERGRLERTWRKAPSIDSLLAALSRLDTVRLRGDTMPIAPRSPDSLDLEVRLPVEGDEPGRSVLAVQILLDRSPFSPGVIDGRWGKNTEKAVFWLQRSAGLAPTGVVDSTTFVWAYDLAGRPPRLLVTHKLTAEDVAGPFVDLPENPYDQDELDCLCYESLTEKLGERFHAAPEILVQLNPEVVLDSLSASDSLVVPAIDDDPPTPTSPIAEIVVSDQGHYLHAVDSAGTILYHFPSTLGSRYQPSPTGTFEVRRVTRNPWFHYQPELLEGVPDTLPPTRLPPGPNNPVGVVWIDLSVEHYGIHGTSDPATIGYVTSSGCVRLTNWDAAILADLVQPGMPVRFRDVTDTERPVASARSK